MGAAKERLSVALILKLDLIDSIPLSHGDITGNSREVYTTNEALENISRLTRAQPKTSL